MGHVREGNPVADQIVFDDLRGGDDDRGVVPQRGAVVGADLAGEDDDLVVGDGEGVAVELGLLFDQRFRRREEQRFAADLVEAFGGDQQADGRLAEAGRQTDQRVAVAGGARQLDLVESTLDEGGS